jgi:Ca2+-binding RTX toxin-like protein
MAYRQPRLRGAILAAGAIIGTAFVTPSPAQAATTVTFSDGILTIVGDSADNSLIVGSTQAGVITLNGREVVGGTATTTNLQRVDIDGGDGNDTLKFDETSPMPPGRFLGGDGNDILTGGPGTDTLDGGPGADSISGNGGDDALTGGTGNDKITGGPGIDTVSMGDDADEFTWKPGDGNDHLNPDAGKDTLKFDTGPATRVNIEHVGTQAILEIPPDPFDPEGTPPKVEMNISGFELVKMNLPDFAEPNTPDLEREVRVNDSPGSGLGVVRVNFAPHTGTGAESDLVLFRGTLGPDRIRLAGSPASGVEVFGLAETVLANRADRLTVFGGDGDDVIDAAGLAAGTTTLTVFGGGNPFDSSHITDGDDTLIGTPGDDSLFGGTGTNHYDGRGGNDTIIDQ